MNVLATIKSRAVGSAATVCSSVVSGVRRSVTKSQSVISSLDRWISPLKSFFSMKKVGFAFLLLYVVFVLIALRILSREHIASPVPGTFVRHTYSYKPKRPVASVNATECYPNQEEVLKPYYHRLDDQTYFLNAYFDQRQGSYIRILSLRRNFAAEVRWNQVYCLVNSAVNHSLIAVPAQDHPLHDNNNNIYGGYILSCNVQGILFENPCKVRLSHHKVLDDHMVTMPTIRLKEQFFYENTFGLCTPPLHDVITQPQLVEFIEVHRLLGVNHFNFYQYQGHPDDPYNNPNINQVLKHYRDAGIVTVFPWKLPINPENNIWSYGKALAIQHCLYSNIGKYRYLVFSDIDEFLIPHSTSTWRGMMEHIDTDRSTGYCAESAIFPPEVTVPLRTLASLRRTENVDTKHIKCIVRPERLLEMGSEGIIKGMDENWPISIMDTGVAMVHHYKFCSMDWDFHNCFDYVIDKCMLRFAEPLKENFKDAMLRISGYRMPAMETQQEQT